jgi:hypothetical protein
VAWSAQGLVPRWVGSPAVAEALRSAHWQVVPLERQLAQVPPRRHRILGRTTIDCRVTPASKDITRGAIVFALPAMGIRRQVQWAYNRTLIPGRLVRAMVSFEFPDPDADMLIVMHCASATLGGEARTDSGGWVGSHRNVTMRGRN